MHNFVDNYLGIYITFTDEHRVHFYLWKYDYL